MVSEPFSNDTVTFRLISRMELAFKIYMGAWLTACVAAGALMYTRRRDIELFDHEYWLMLFQRWKLVTFLISSVSLTVIAPYTGDPTWDYIDAAFMSILAYTTAPWTVGIVYRTFRHHRNWEVLYVAICVWMFSASWSYDGYLVLRDGEYPFTWLPNIFASGVLYVCAGLLWSLEWREGYGVYFGFMDKDWPKPSNAGVFAKIIWIGLPFMIIVAAMIIPFLL